ncbi:MAG: bifunctional transaldolase/phosoglucose isomerase [Thermodesulfobacteriota bacterium]|jgi:transaldolase/glucose-6-phosphate isomerase
MDNPLVALQKFGQSVWYDNIRRSLITSGELQAMVEHDGLLGVTSNPAIFEKALAGSVDYDQAMRALVEQGVGNAQDVYEHLAVQDIQLAADVLRPVYLRTRRRDGYVSFEVSPHLAHDTRGTIEEARRLHRMIGRDNVMIKVPATPEGIPAITQLISEGININVTLLFAVEVYEAVAQAYMDGLERLAAQGGDVSTVASVASFFVSRVDSLVDEKLSQALDATRDPDRREKLKGLVGKIAIANAKVAYALYRDLIAQGRWKALAAKGAMTQRLLWASTSTKNPKYPPTIYVDELIGPDTVNTMPAETLNAFRATGRPRASLTENWAENIEQARQTLRTLAEVGISLKEATDHLLADGVKKFVEPFDKLLSAVEKKRQELLGSGLARQTYSLGEFAAAVEATSKDWREGNKVRRLWRGDASLWTGADESQWLGWLHVVDGQRDHPEHIRQITDDVRQAGFTHALLLGMGGSSLCPEVMRRTFGVIDGFPELVVLDSTVPAQVKTVAQKIDPARTLFIVSSKSGSTTEPTVFKQYFMDLARKAVGAERVGSRFIAITDPGTPLHKLAKSERFRHIVHGVPSIGGRYSALSNFGMVPAAIMGVDVPRFLDSTELMVQSCASCVPPEVNPGVTLGIILGTLARQGRDKVTIVTSPAIGSLGAWLEQLLAESTGKDGTGLIPVDDERLGPPEVYGTDRLFVYVRLTAAPSAEQDAAVAALERAGHPVVRIVLEDVIELGQEFFRWEIATAVAGSILGINAFNQPDVEASKVATRRLTAAYEETGALPPETPVLQEGGLSVFTDPKNAEALRRAAARHSLAAYLAAHLGRIRAGDYFAVNAYVEMNEANHAELQALRHAVRDAKRVATTLGFGPRFLHSTGQLHKGGPNTGVFLQVTAEDAEDLPIPGQKYSFGVLKRAQAQGDFEVLAERGRRVLRVHLGPDVRAGLASLRDLIGRALS